MDAVTVGKVRLTPHDNLHDAPISALGTGAFAPSTTMPSIVTVSSPRLAGPKVEGQRRREVRAELGRWRCAVWILRVRRPELPRSFKVAAVPVVSTLGILVCGAMVYGLGWTNWLRLGVWMVIGLVLYFSYGRSHSRLMRAGP
jgi:hypothetical protein